MATWFVYALGAAIFSALRDIVVKQSSSDLRPTSIAFGQYLVASPILLTFALFSETPKLNIDFFLAAMFSSIFVAIGTLAFFKALELSDISLMTPLRSLTPLILFFLGPLIFSEKVTALGGLAVLLLVIGLSVVGSRHGVGFLQDFRSAPGTKYLLIAVNAFAIVALFEKWGIRASSPIIFTAVEVLMTTSILFVISAKQDGFRLELGKSSSKIVFVGVFFSAMMLSQAYAFNSGPLSYAVSIKRLSTLFTVVYGSFILGEGYLRRRLLGVVILLLGSILLAFVG